MDQQPETVQEDSRDGSSPRSQQTVAWVLVALWAMFVWGLGSDQMSAAETSRILRPLIEYFFPDLTTYQMYKILVAIRKAAHVVEYALLGILAFRAFYLGKRPSLAVSAALALAFVISFAAADETRQFFSQARTGSAMDVMLDALGAGGAIALLFYLQVRKPRA